MQRDDYRDDLPVTRGQWKAIAEDALDVLLIAHPQSRLGATEIIARLRRTISNSDLSSHGGGSAGADRPDF